MPSDAQTDRRKIQEGAVGDPTVVHSYGAEMLDRPRAFSEYARQRSGIFVAI